MPASSNTGIKAIVAELKGIRYCLESIWHTRYTDGETRRDESSSICR